MLSEVADMLHNLLLLLLLLLLAAVLGEPGSELQISQGSAWHHSVSMLLRPGLQKLSRHAEVRTGCELVCRSCAGCSFC